MKFKAYFELDGQHVTWLFDADNWNDAMNRSKEKMLAINLPLRLIERID